MAIKKQQIDYVVAGLVAIIALTILFSNISNYAPQGAGSGFEASLVIGKGYCFTAIEPKCGDYIPIGGSCASTTYTATTYKYDHSIDRECEAIEYEGRLLGDPLACHCK